MNEDQMQGKFEQFKGKIKETWGRLSDDDIALADGKMEQFLGKVQQTYGLTKEAAQKSYDELARTYLYSENKGCNCPSDKSS